ncbi:hypothetical protein DSM104299_03390 [Baekduia alba]|uniref:hypothetical protein n=1 Tax=Baekduia alba TaxID=2997333 RepID=UPI00234212C5|nr:hypothetical protein [Baekduia alba]WCB94652.1 hypothetical protein DSM104299_03390 [Baekduia alba]
MARAARDATGAQRAWVFASVAPHARLRLTGSDGGAVPEAADALALRTAGVAINAELAVVVLGEAPGPLADAAFLGVPVPFVDGRMGALVVIGGQPLVAGRAAADALVALAWAQVQVHRRVGGAR